MCLTLARWEQRLCEVKRYIEHHAMHSHDKELDAKRNDEILYRSVLRRMHHAHSHCMRVSAGPARGAEALLTWTVWWIWVVITVTGDHSGGRAPSIKP
jgi:hypothetical protein